MIQWFSFISHRTYFSLFSFTGMSSNAFLLSCSLSMKCPVIFFFASYFQLTFSFVGKQKEILPVWTRATQTENWKQSCRMNHWAKSCSTKLFYHSAWSMKKMCYLLTSLIPSPEAQLLLRKASAICPGWRNGPCSKRRLNLVGMTVWIGLFTVMEMNCKYFNLKSEALQCLEEWGIRSAGINQHNSMDFKGAAPINTNWGFEPLKIHLPCEYPSVISSVLHVHKITLNNAFGNWLFFLVNLLEA